MTFLIKYIEEKITQYIMKKKYELEVSETLRNSYDIEDTTTKLWLLIRNYCVEFAVTPTKAIEELDLMIMEEQFSEFRLQMIRKQKIKRLQE